MKKRIWIDCRSFFSVIRTCFTLSWKTSALYTVLRLSCNLLVPALSLAGAFLGKYILNLIAGISQGPNPIWYLFSLSGGLLLANVLRSLLQKAQIYAQNLHEEIINRELALFMMDKAGTADIEYFDNAEYYDKLSACTRDAFVISQLLWNTISAVGALFSLIVSFIALSRLKWIYGVLMLCATIPASIASVKYTKTLYTLSLEQINGERQKSYLQSLLLDRRYAQGLRLFDVCDKIKGKYSRLWDTLFLEKKSINKKRAILTGLLECLPEFMMVLIGFDIAVSVLNDCATVGDYSLYTGLISQLWNGVYMLSNTVIQIYDNQLKVSNLRTLGEYPNRILDTGTIEVNRIDTIEFTHVSFSYPGTQKQVLDDVSFYVGKGERVALVGLNGSGKSTLIKLLLRLYETDKGNIKINGVDIRGYKLKSLRQNFSVYFQDDPSYSFTLRENIVIADMEKPRNDAEIVRALTDSGAGDILERSQAGLDASISRLFDSQGIELSGGQYQKLALARAFYRRHSVLILDEPSSNLDPRSEHQIFEKLKTFTKGKTTLFTSHRLTNVTLADRIVVLENGRVLEEGTQRELLEHDGRFAELFRYQQERYQTD